jgi:hypothetical protein
LGWLCYNVAPQHEEESDGNCHRLLRCATATLQRNKKNKKKATTLLPSPFLLQCNAAKKNKKKATALLQSPSSLCCNVAVAKKKEEKGDGVATIAFFVVLQRTE